MTSYPGFGDCSCSLFREAYLFGGKKKIKLCSKSSTFTEKNPNPLDSKCPRDCRDHSVLFTYKIWVLFIPKKY